MFTTQCSGEVRFQRVTGYTGLMRFGFPSGTPSIRTSGGFQIKGSDAWGADLYIKSDGNVGIGTDAPVQNFHIAGGSSTAYQKFTNDAVGNTINDGTSLGIDADGDFLINNAEAKEIKLYTSDTQRVTIASDGTLNVNSAKFKINGSAGSSGQTLTTDGSGNISWSAAGSGTISGSGTDNYVPRFNGTSALQNSAIFSNDSGSVGIGTDAPASNQKLDVMFADNINGAGVTFRNDDGSLQFQNVAGSGEQFNPQIKGNSKHTNNVGLRLLGNAASGEDSGTTPLILLRGTVNNAKATTRPVLHVEDGAGDKLVAVAADGNVGIGTTAPSNLLHVHWATGGYATLGYATNQYAVN